MDRVVNYVQVRSVEDYETFARSARRRLLRSHRQIRNRKARCSRLRSCRHAGSAASKLLLIARERLRRGAQIIDVPERVCAVTRRRFPVGANPTRRTLQPEATGAVMEVTK